MCLGPLAAHLVPACVCMCVYSDQYSVTCHCPLLIRICLANLLTCISAQIAFLTVSDLFIAPVHLLLHRDSSMHTHADTHTQAGTQQYRMDTTFYVAYDNSHMHITAL